MPITTPYISFTASVPLQPKLHRVAPATAARDRHRRRPKVDRGQLRRRQVKAKPAPRAKLPARPDPAPLASINSLEIDNPRPVPLRSWSVENLIALVRKLIRTQDVSSTSAWIRGRSSAIWAGFGSPSAAPGRSPPGSPVPRSLPGPPAVAFVGYFPFPHATYSTVPPLSSAAGRHHS